MGNRETDPKINNPEESKRKGAKKCRVSNPELPTVARQMTLGMSRCHLFPLSGLSTNL